jgi:hypothetical protein
MSFDINKIKNTIENPITAEEKIPIQGCIAIIYPLLIPPIYLKNFLINPLF